MSRAYRIAVTEQLRRHIKVEDGVSSQLEVLPILPSERMGELLGAELKERGFERDGNKAVRKEKDGVEVVVDLKTGRLDVTGKGDKQIDVSVERSGLADDTSRDKNGAASQAVGVSSFWRGVCSLADFDFAGASLGYSAHPLAIVLLAGCLEGKRGMLGTMLLLP